MTSLKNSSPRILVVGDLMVDHYLWGACHRINPEAPVPVVDVSSEDFRLGGAGNVTRNLLALGARVAVASVVGVDASGRDLLAMLGQLGLTTDAIVVEPDRQTSRKTRVIATHQQVVRFDKESKAPITAESEAALLTTVRDRLGSFDAVLLSDYGKGVLTPRLTQALVDAAKAQAIPVLVDPKGHDFSKYRGATVITPNKREAEQFAGFEIGDEASLERAGALLQSALGIRYAIITLSHEGMAVFDEGMTRIPALAQEVFDVTGAGDTVFATIGFALASGLGLHEAAQLANTAAAIVIGKLGVATATLDEIAQFDSHLSTPDPAHAVKTRHEIETIARALRDAGKKIVFTNGCFDLLHRGHVEY